MRYPIVIEPGTEASAFGVVVPDLPGCFSAGDTLEEALANVEESIEAWIDATLDSGESIPAPSPIAEIQARPEFEGWIVGVTTVDPAALEDRPERVNLSLPKRVLRRLDAQARATGMTRSGYVAELTLSSRR